MIRFCCRALIRSICHSVATLQSMTGRIGFPGWAETSFVDMHLSSSFLKRRYSDFVALARDLTPDGRATLRRRAIVEDKQNSISNGATSLFGGVTLIDGNFDNPNFWFRYALLRSALGLANGREIGAIGPYRRKHVRTS